MQIRHNFICVKFKFVAFILIYDERFINAANSRNGFKAFIEVQVFLQTIFEKGCN